MWCGVLGPLVVRRADGTTVTVGGSARRLLFAALLSRAGRTVAPDVLIEDVWGQVPPRSAAKTLQSHMVRLRHDLGRGDADAVLLTERTGYRLVLGQHDLDATDFEDGVRAAGAPPVSADPSRAFATLDRALALWRGDAYEEFADAPFCVAERVRLFELRALAEEQRTDHALALGAAEDLVPALEKRVATAPYRERGWEQLIVALYRSGRQADALATYRRACSTLAEDLAIDPGPRLRGLESRILHQDPELLAASAGASVQLSEPHRDVCPYRGLASYVDTDADLFVGRERLTAQLVGMLADNRVVVVVGASGTGKSSALRAGLIPALRAGALPGSAAWRSAVITPADELSGALTGELDLVVLDQAEELFTRLSAAGRRAAIERLEEFVGAGGRAVLALRGDFYGRLAEVRPLAAYAQTAAVLVGPMREDELRRVVVEPAERVGLHVDDELVEAVLDEVAGQPAALPLLSAALVRTWANRDGRTLTLDGYRRGGGVASAVEATAEEAYLRLDDDERAVARRLLVRLAGREADSWVRRPVRRADIAVDDTSVRVLSALAADRLVTITDARVEITHDALLAHWPRLRGWLEERVLAAELLDHLDVASRAWHEAGRPGSDLYRGARLHAAADWRDDHPDDITALEAEFLAASEAAAGAELLATRRQLAREAHGRRRLRAVAIGLAAMVMLAAVGIGVAVHERASADRAAAQARASALTADARRLAAQSLTAPDIASSSLLAVAAYRLQNSPDTRGALLAAVERNQSALWRVQVAHRIQSIATNPAGTRVAVIDNRRMLSVYDTRTRRLVSRFFSHGYLVTGMSRDGRQVVVSGPDPRETVNHNRVAIFDVATGHRTRVLTEDDDNNRLSPVMSQDARWLAVLGLRHVAGRVAIRIYDAHRWVARPRTVFVPVDPTGLAVSRTSLAVQNPDGSVRVWSLPSLRPIARVVGPRAAPQPGVLVVAPDGGTVAVSEVNDPTRVTVYPTRGGTPTIVPTQPQGVSAAAYAPDGRALAVGSFSGSLNVYRPATGALAEALTGESGPLLGLAWSGTTHASGLYSGGLDSQLVSWGVSDSPRLITEAGPDLHAPDRGELFGHTVLGMTPADGPSAGERGYALDVRTGHLITWPLTLPTNGYLNQLVTSSDGRTALASEEDTSGHNTVVVQDLVHDRKLGTLHLPPDAPSAFGPGDNAALSPDGRTAYVNLNASRIGVFAVPSGTYLRSFTIKFAQPDAARVLAIPWQFAPDGTLVFGGADTGPHQPDAGGIGPNDATPPDQRLGRVDVHTGRLLAQTGLGDVTSPTALAWSPDHRLLAVGTYDGTLALYDARTLHRVATAGVAEPGAIRTVSFSPTGSDLVSAGTPGTLNSWSVPGLSREASPIAVGNGANNGGIFAWYRPTGRIVGLAPDVRRPGTDLQRWFTFDSAPGDLVRTACLLAGGTVSRARWAQLAADQPYRRVC